MKTGLIVLSIFLCAFSMQAQTISLPKWVNKTLDSLRKTGVDTIVYYHSYCGECMVLSTGHDCNIVDDNSWTQIENTFIYKKEGIYYALKLICGAAPFSQLNNCQSVKYFISIFNILNERDKSYRARAKKQLFMPPMPADQTYEEATIYYGKFKQVSNISSYQKRDGYKVWKKFPWIDPEIKLFKLIQSDLIVN